jgi:A1 cistron-splicing factor AAR2
MNQEIANKCISHIGVFLCLDVPEKVEFGIDNNCWVVGNLFKGIKLIPLGLHYISLCVDGGTKFGFFINFSKENLVIVKRWNPATETFFEELEQDEIDRYALGVSRFDFDQYLGAYPIENYKNWVNLSSYISSRTIRRLHVKDAPIFEKSKPLDRNELNFLNNNITDSADTHSKIMNESIHFLELKKHIFPKNFTPQLVTKYGVDKSCNLRFIKNKCGTYEEILAEFQFSFTTFLYGQNYDSFEQWKKMLEIICRSDECMELASYEDFYANFLTVLYFQLKEFPDDLFLDIIDNSGTNFIILSLKELFSSHSLNKNPKSKINGEKFRALVSKKFKINFDDEINIEDEPVLVYLDEETKHWSHEERQLFLQGLKDL